MFNRLFSKAVISATHANASSFSLNFIEEMTPEKFSELVDKKCKGIKSADVRNLYKWLIPHYATFYQQFYDAYASQTVDLAQQYSPEILRQINTLYVQRFLFFKTLLDYQNPEERLKLLVQEVRNYQAAYENREHLDQDIICALRHINQLNRNIRDLSTQLDYEFIVLDPSNADSYQKLRSELRAFLSKRDRFLLAPDYGTIKSVRPKIEAAIKKLDQLDFDALLLSFERKKMLSKLPADTRFLKLFSSYCAQYLNQENLEAYLLLGNLRNYRVIDIMSADGTPQRENLVKMLEALILLRDIFLKSDAYNAVNLDDKLGTQLIHALNAVIIDLRCLETGTQPSKTLTQLPASSPVLADSVFSVLNDTLEHLILTGNGPGKESLLAEFVTSFTTSQARQSHDSPRVSFNQ